MSGGADGLPASADLDQVLDWHARHAGVRLSADRPHPSTVPRVGNRQVGPIQVARSRVPEPLTVVATHSDVYALATVHRGSVRVNEARHRWDLSPAVAGLYRPPRALRRNLIAPYTTLTYLLIGRHDVERLLEELIEQYIPGPVDFAPQLPVHGRPAWLRLLRIFTDVFEHPDSAVHHPMVYEPLREAMIGALLHTADHPYREHLLRPAAPIRPRHLRIVLDALHSEPERAYTADVLARIAGVSIRTLQQGFRDHVGMPPLTYLRRVRLARVHDHLQGDDGGTVSEVAHRWGFTHLGRFAADYAAVYGVAPSVTRTMIR